MSKFAIDSSWLTAIDDRAREVAADHGLEYTASRQALIFSGLKVKPIHGFSSSWADSVIHSILGLDPSVTSIWAGTPRVRQAA